jgi:hypothetical protein
MSAKNILISIAAVIAFVFIGAAVVRGSYSVGEGLMVAGFTVFCGFVLSVAEFGGGDGSGGGGGGGWFDGGGDCGGGCGGGCGGE